MAETTILDPHIDEYLFERQFSRFRKHVFDKSGKDLVSFPSNPYTDKEEGYKYGVHHEGRQTLGLDEWQEADIGQGKILRSVVAAIELKGNNLLKWPGQWGEKSKPHNKLIEALPIPRTRKRYEELLFRLYNGDDAVGFRQLGRANRSTVPTPFVPLLFERPLSLYADRSDIFR